MAWKYLHWFYFLFYVYLFIHVTFKGRAKGIVFTFPKQKRNSSDIVLVSDSTGFVFKKIMINNLLDQYLEKFFVKSFISSKSLYIFL